MSNFRILELPNFRTSSRGFTLVELMLVIAVLAVLATLTTGGVLKSMKAAREKRVDTMCQSLTTALMSYYAQEGHWPVGLEPGTENNTKISQTGDAVQDAEIQKRVIFSGEYNSRVFQNLVPRKGAKGVPYLSPAELMTKPTVNVQVPNKKRQTAVMTLREAIDGGASPLACPLGYPDVDNPATFRYFRVEFNLMTDSVSVSR